MVLGNFDDLLTLSFKFLRNILLEFNTVSQLLSILLIIFNCLKDLGRSWIPSNRSLNDEFGDIYQNVEAME